jgi:hypothetical protein
MLRQMLALVLCGAIAGTGCASASGSRFAQAQAPQAPPAAGAAQADNSAIAEYVQRLAPGSKVRVEQTDGTSFRGTLMKATPQAMVVQKNTRVPEPPLEIPLDRVARVTISTNGSTGKTIAIGVGTGVAVTFGIFAVLAALFAGD